MSITSLLNKTKQEDFVKKLLPEAAFLARIVEANTLPRYWGPKEGKRTEPAYAICYAPTFEIMAYLPTGDDELDAQNNAILENYGDWKGLKLHNNYRGTVPTMGDQKLLLSGVGPGNYELGSCDPYFGTQEGEEYFSVSSRLSAFMEAKPDGSIGGFVALLSADPTTQESIKLPSKPFSNLPKVIAATEGAYLILDMGIESDPQYGERNIIRNVSSVG